MTYKGLRKSKKVAYLDMAYICYIGGHGSSNTFLFVY